MRPIILPADTTVFPSAGTNGIGRLSDCYKCLVTEEINATFSLTAGCMVNSTHADLIVEGNYLYVPHDSTEDLQPFEIKRVTKKSNGNMEIYAEHISYKLNRVTCAPFEEASLSAALAAIPNNLDPANNFTFSTNISSSVGYKLNHPMSGRALLNGEEGSLVDVYGQGEWLFDKWTCTMMSRRGANNGARIRSKHNLTDLTIQSEAGNGYHAIYPYYWDSYTGTLVLASLSGNTGRVVIMDGYTDYDAAIPVDLTDRFTNVPTQNQVRLEAIKWLASNKPDAISDPSVSVRFSALVDDSASSVVLGDTVTVTDKTLNYEGQHRIVRTVWDVLNERYDSVTVGRLPQSLYDLIRSVK